MNEMTLPSRRRIRNTSPGGLRPSTRSRRFSIGPNIESGCEKDDAVIEINRDSSCSFCMCFACFLLLTLINTL